MAPADEDKQSIAVVLQAQVVCIEWTTQANFGILPAPWLNGSLLILGTRAGTLTFLRSRNGELPEQVASLSVADIWITHLAFSTWNLVQSGWCEGYLAYGTSDGSIGLVKISQTLLEEDCFSFVPEYIIKLDLDHQRSQMVYDSQNLAGITALRWINIAGRNPILVTSNPGLIKLWSPPSNKFPTTDGWTGYRSLLIKSQKISVDSSAFHHVTGILYLENQDALVITLFDGSFHVIRDLSRDPQWASISDIQSHDDEVDYGTLTSENLSKVSRTLFVKAEKGNVDRRDMVRINGVAPYDDASCFSWMYESSRPSDFSYKHDAKHSNMLIVARMWDEHNDELYLYKLSRLLNTVKTSSGLGPLHILRPFLLQLRDPVELDRLRERFLEVLKPRFPEDDSLKVQITSWEGDITPEVRVKFRVGLSTNLFGSDDLLSLRMRLSLADVSWKLTSNEKKQMECGLIAQDLLNTISHRVLRTIIRHIVAIVKTLTYNEMPFVSRMVVQSLLPGSPLDLTEEGRNLSNLVQHLVGTPGPPTENSAPFNIASQLNEICPACGVQVPLQDITTAVCDNGHNWARCSVTTFILSTPWVRTCVGCSRKAFLPPSAHKELPTIAQAWVVEELLEAVHRCLFCNNGFVSVL